MGYFLQFCSQTFCIFHFPLRRSSVQGHLQRHWNSFLVCWNTHPQNDSLPLKPWSTHSLMSSVIPKQNCQMARICLLSLTLQLWVIRIIQIDFFFFFWYDDGFRRSRKTESCLTYLLLFFCIIYQNFLFVQIWSLCLSLLTLKQNLARVVLMSTTLYQSLQVPLVSLWTRERKENGKNTKKKGKNKKKKNEMNIIKISMLEKFEPPHCPTFFLKKKKIS